jgi:hypothetical protein
MALTLSTLGSVTALAIDDSACVEANGTYDLIFTGDNTAPATGTYTIVSNVITSVSLTSGGSGYSSAPTVATQTGDGSVTASFMSLASAQDSQSRHPLVEIISAQKGNEIPFDGTYLTPETFNEYSSAPIAHSTGRLCKAYCYGPEDMGDSVHYNSGIKYVYTDTDRTEFTTVTITLYTNPAYEMKSVSICAMTDGNIGIICMVDDSSANVYRILRRIVTVTGTAVSNAEIASWSHGTYTSDPWVSTIAANSYLLVYGKISGSDYYIYKRTSADFVTWSAEGALTIGGPTSTWRLANPSILKISAGDLWLCFDALESIGPGGEELTNVYYSVSADAGANWADAVKLTNYTTYGEIGLHPTTCQKTADQMHMIFTRQVGALHMDDTATGWPTGDYTVELSWDSVNRKLYAVNCNGGSANKYLQCVVKIDVDTWAVDQYWDSTTTPGFPSFICDNTHHVWFGNKMHDGHHIAICCTNNDHRFVWHLDGENDTITGYYVDTQLEHSILSNTTIDALNEHYNRINGLQVDADNERIYVWIVSAYLYHAGVYVGYIDLTETSGYAMHTVLYVDRMFGTNNTYVSGIGGTYSGGIYIDTVGNRVAITGTTAGTWDGFCKVYDIESAGELVSWDGAIDTDFPKYGLRKPFVYGDKLYAGLGAYYSGGTQSTFRGLCEIDLVSEIIKFHRPSYCTEDDHLFGRPYYIGNDRLAMTHPGYGVAIFDMIGHTWELFSNDNVPGLTLDGLDDWKEAQIAYDEMNEIIFVGDPGNGVIAFSLYGYLRQAYYSIGTFSGGTWSFAAATQLVQGFRDFEAVAVPDPGNATSMYCFWNSEDSDGEQSIKWDKDGSSLNLSEYLIDDEITLERTIDGNPATLSFSVSHGHLFDPYNQNSLLSLYLKKGRKLTIRWGELISGTEYWQNAGTFYVQSGSIRIARGEYPVMKIEALDQRALWQNSHVYATDIYANTPEEILTDLMTDIADMAVGEIDTLSIDNSSTLYNQWIETTLDDILTQVCERYGYYYRFTVDGKFSVRKITNLGTVTHTYADHATIIEYTPDDRYSDFTNRVTVIGQERDYTTVLFNEEQVATLQGTLGWWGCKKEHVVWFSTDQSRRCMNPRLVVLETAMSIPMRLAGNVEESIEECPEAGDFKYCTVNVKAPNLIGPLIGNVLGYVALCSIPDMGEEIDGTVIVSLPWGRLLQSVAMTFICMILGSVVNYQYAIYAQPLGSIRRSVQGQADDTEHQAEIGCVVEQKMEDPLCYSVADCNQVANFELMVAQMQRKRVSITKVAHLQDEDGDTIRFVHPYSGADIDLYVTNIRRKFKKGSDGYFIDEIDGWLVNQ